MSSCSSRAMRCRSISLRGAISLRARSRLSVTRVRLRDVANDAEEAVGAGLHDARFEGSRFVQRQLDS